MWQSFTDQSITNILEEVHCNKNITLEKSPNLKKYISDTEYQWTIIFSILTADKWSRSNAKIFNAASVLAGESECSKIFARMIYSARDEKQLTNFLSFALTVIQYFPNLMTFAVRYFIQNIPELSNEYSSFSLCSKNVNSLGARYLINLLTIIQWQQNSDVDGDLRYIGLSLSDLRGELQIGIFDWALSYTEKISEQFDNILNETSENMLNVFLCLMNAVIPTVQLSLNHLYKIVSQIGALLASLLKFVNIDNEIDGVDIVCRCFSIIGKFFINVSRITSDQLVSAFMDEVLENSDEIFGSSATTALDYRTIGVKADFNRIAADLLTPDIQSESSLLRQLRDMPLEVKSAASIAHSGKFTRKVQPKREIEISNSKELRKILFINFVQILCTGTDGNGKPDKKCCQKLGECLIRRFGGNGCTASLSWRSWDQEKELIPQYVETDKNFEEYLYLYYLIFTLSRLGPNGLAFILPLLKARFASFLINLETTPSKSDCLKNQDLQKLAEIFSPLIMAKIYPRLLIDVFGIISKATKHEAHILLVDFWNFLKLIINDETIDFLNCDAGVDDSFYFTKPEGMYFASSLVLIIQRNIAKPRMAEYLPKILKYKNIENESYDDWSIERVPSAISVGQEIKRS